MSLIEILVLCSLFISVGCWEYCFFFRNQNTLPMRQGFDVFSLFLRIISGVALIKIFGRGYGFLCLFGEMFFLQYITHFTIGIIFNFIFPNKPLPVEAIFAAMIRIDLILTVLLFIL